MCALDVNDVGYNSFSDFCVQGDEHLISIKADISFELIVSFQLLNKYSVTPSYLFGYLSIQGSLLSNYYACRPASKWSAGFHCGLVSTNKFKQCSVGNFPDFLHVVSRPVDRLVPRYGGCRSTATQSRELIYIPGAV